MDLHIREVGVLTEHGAVLLQHFDGRRPVIFAKGAPDYGILRNLKGVGEPYILLGLEGVGEATREALHGSIQTGFTDLTVLNQSVGNQAREQDYDYQENYQQ